MKKTFQAFFAVLLLPLVLCSCLDSAHVGHRSIRHTITLSLHTDGYDVQGGSQQGISPLWKDGDKVKVNGYDYTLHVDNKGRITVPDVARADRYVAIYPAEQAAPSLAGAYTLHIPRQQTFETDDNGRQILRGAMLGDGGSDGRITFHPTMAVLDVAVKNEHVRPIRLVSIEVESDQAALWGKTGRIACCATPTGEREWDTRYLHIVDSCGRRVKLNFDNACSTLSAGDVCHYYIPVTNNENNDVHYTFRVKATELNANGTLTGNAVQFCRQTTHARSLRTGHVSSVFLHVDPLDAYAVCYPTNTSIVLPGQGTRENPYIIRNVEDFNHINDVLTSENQRFGFNMGGVFGQGVYFCQVSDINGGGSALNSVWRESEWLCFTWPLHFAGHYDGCGHCIFNYTDNAEGRPLFPYVEDASITNLYVQHESPAGSPLIGTSENSLIENIHVSTLLQDFFDFLGV
ncbi:MAG: hypothetical protein MJZ35_07350 [Bacteroidaceae bacterium]|nr:hypothetical protein [Bacteroidaceae bacterium]